MPLGVGAELFDIKVIGVNINEFLLEYSNYTGIPCAIDGIFRPATKAAAQRAGVTAVKALCKRREQYFRAIVDAHPLQSKFLKGWLVRASECEIFAGSLA